MTLTDVTSIVMKYQRQASLGVIGSVIGASGVMAGAWVAMQITQARGSLGMNGGVNTLLGPPGSQGLTGVFGPIGSQGHRFTIKKRLSPKDWSPRTGKCICTHKEEA